MAVLLTASKSFRLSAEAALALERLAAIAGRSQSALLTLLLTHFETAQLAKMTSEQQADYRAAQLSHADMKGIHGRRSRTGKAAAEPTDEPAADLNLQGMAALGQLISLRGE